MSYRARVRTHWTVIVGFVGLLGATGCKKAAKDGATGSGSAAVAGSGSGSGSGAGSAGSAAGSAAGSGSGSEAGSGSGSGSGSAAAVKPLPKLEAEQVLVVTDKPGGKVKFYLDDKTVIEVDDGTVAKKTDTPKGVEAPAGDDHEQTQHVEIAGKSGFLDSKSFVDKDAIELSPDGQWAMLVSQESCGDFCHNIVYLAHGAEQRWKVSDTVAPVMAWHPKMTHAAFGGDGSSVVFALPDAKEVLKLPELTAPAYSPSGELYVRDAEYNILTVDAAGKSTKVGKGEKPEEEEGVNNFPSPVTFDKAGKWEDPDNDRPGAK